MKHERLRRRIVGMISAFLLLAISVSSALAASVYFKSVENRGNYFKVAAYSPPIQPAPPQSSAPPVLLEPEPSGEAPKKELTIHCITDGILYEAEDMITVIFDPDAPEKEWQTVVTASVDCTYSVLVTYSVDGSCQEHVEISRQRNSEMNTNSISSEPISISADEQDVFYIKFNEKAQSGDIVCLTFEKAVPQSSLPTE